MILDHIENAHFYSTLSGRLAEALHCVRTTDFSRMAPGRYEVEGENLFFMVNEYATKNQQECELEGHRQYIDLQFMIAGSELIGYAALRNQPASVISEPEEDCWFYQGESSLFLLEEGMFAVFFPADLHMPCVRARHERVKKVVVKIRA